MLLSRYLVPFTYYNLILIILFFLSVSSIESFSIINSISYIFLHFLIIYLGLYYYRRTLYSIYFLCGLGFDILLINQIGPSFIYIYDIIILFLFNKKIFYLFKFSKNIFVNIIYPDINNIIRNATHGFLF